MASAAVEITDADIAKHKAISDIIKEQEWKDAALKYHREERRSYATFFKLLFGILLLKVLFALTKTILEWFNYHHLSRQLEEYDCIFGVGVVLVCSLLACDQMSLTYLK